MRPFHPRRLNCQSRTQSCWSKASVCRLFGLCSRASHSGRQPVATSGRTVLGTTSVISRELVSRPASCSGAPDVTRQCIEDSKRWSSLWQVQKASAIPSRLQSPRQLCREMWPRRRSVFSLLLRRSGEGQIARCQCAIRCPAIQHHVHSDSLEAACPLPVLVCKHCHKKHTLTQRLITRCSFLLPVPATKAEVYVEIGNLMQPGFKNLTLQRASRCACGPAYCASFPVRLVTTGGQRSLANHWSSSVSARDLAARRVCALLA